MAKPSELARTTLDRPTSGETSRVTLDEERRAVRSFLDDEIRRKAFTPVVDAWLTGADIEFSQRLAARGWVGMAIPTKYGGHGRSELERLAVNEELLAAGAPVAAHWIADRQMAPSILRNGSERQREKYLPDIAAARRFFSIGMSEEGAGSDLAAIRTRARKVANGWILTGTKLWTTGAHYATNLVVLARTDDAPRRHEGLSQFLVDLPHDAIDIRPIRSIDGGEHFNEVVFDDAFVPDVALLGQRGQGWRQVLRELAAERSGPERYMTTVPLLRAWGRIAPDALPEAARHDLAPLLARLILLRQMSTDVARRIERGTDPTVEAAIVKDLGTTLEGRITEVVRTHAQAPMSSGTTIDRLLREAITHAPVFTLRGGTNEVLRSVIAKSLVAP